MALLKFFSDLTQGYTEYQAKDEMVFGEIVRIFDKKGYPCIEFKVDSGCQSGRFLLQGEVLFAVTVTLDKKIGGAGFLTLMAEVRNKLADPDDMIKMFKTDFMNFGKLGFGGQIKINHEYNTIYAHTKLLKNIGSYLSGKGVVDAARLEADIWEYVDKLEDTLRKFKKD